MDEAQLLVAIDVGAHRHRVAIGERSGRLLEEFDVEHTARGLSGLVGRLKALQAARGGCALAVAMEGHNGWARPLDRAVLACGWQLFSVNNLKLARYEEIFPAPAKSDAIDARRMLELFRLSGELGASRGVLQPVLALKEQIGALEGQIAALSEGCTMARRIATVPGFGLICAAELAGEIGTLERFASEAGLALYVGVAAMRHAERVAQSRAYYEEKRQEGKTHNQAVRALGRQLVRVLWAMLRHGHDYRPRWGLLGLRFGLKIPAGCSGLQPAS